MCIRDSPEEAGWIIPPVGSIGGERAIAILAELLHNPDESIRRQAAAALSRLNDPRMIEPVLLALRDPATGVRAGAAHNLSGAVKDDRLTDRLIALQEQIDRALKKIGYPAEARGFKPHLTIGRVKHPSRELADLTAILKEHADLEIGRTNLDHVTVFSSELAPEGPTYHVLAEAPLGQRR